LSNKETDRSQAGWNWFIIIHHALPCRVAWRPLVTHYVEVYARRMGRRIEHIAGETLAAFQSYRWPGNIRELQNLIERAVIMSNDGVLPNPLSPPPDLLPPALQPESVRHSPQQTTLRESERTLILRTLAEAGWVVGGAGGAAAKLGLKRTTLIAKMKKMGVARPTRKTHHRVHREGAG
jgi:DNA-binding NtrC family response regulator